MPPVLPSTDPFSTPSPPHQSRIVRYHQTHYHNGKFVSILPLLAPECGVTHIIIAAIHLNALPADVTLNDDPYNAPKHEPLWQECKQLQASGVKILGMLGGAAKGSYTRLDGPTDRFEAFYGPLKEMIEYAKLDGLDLDVEEQMSLPGVIRLIDRLKQDFGRDFIITLAPVATGLQLFRPHLSGFSYFELEKAFGRYISWYNTQFYCGWGSMNSIADYEKILMCGWDPKKIVVGVVTNPGNGAGWVPDDVLCDTLSEMRDRDPDNFGGVMGWEYFNSMTTSNPEEGPWSWSRLMTLIVRPHVLEGLEAQE
uniref:Chitinase n=1 Tax=Orbilia oligospora TaxID=2813651 RepID=A0A097P6H2_ORBOL|nr:chitinase [Orbilia oligospora]